MEEDKGITITYETLFEILRREKDRLELQKLSNSFLNDVVSYLKEKQNLVERKEEQQELFTEEERIKTEKQLGNIKKILRDLYERREKKIITMAIDKSKTKSDLIDTSAMLDEEKGLFDSLVKILDENRENVLLRLLNAELAKIAVEKKTDEGQMSGTHEVSEHAQKSPPFGTQREQSSFVSQKQDMMKGNHDTSDGASVNSEREFKEAGKPIQEKPTKLIRFKHAVPKFAGLEDEEFGPFEEEDMASLPKEIADVLINKGRVEEIKED